METLVYKRDRVETKRSRPANPIPAHPSPTPSSLFQALSLPLPTSATLTNSQPERSTTQPQNHPIPQLTTAITHSDSPKNIPTGTHLLNTADQVATTTPCNPATVCTPDAPRHIGCRHQRPFIPTLSTSDARRSRAAASTTRDSSTPGSATAMAIRHLVEASPFAASD